MKERQEIELTAQRATLQEQRQYIDILDTALTKAQENVVRVEKDHSERVSRRRRFNIAGSSLMVDSGWLSGIICMGQSLMVVNEGSLEYMNGSVLTVDGGWLT